MKKRRLFFALWPPDEVRESIVSVSRPFLQGVQGRIIRSQNLHITLHFIGSVDGDLQECLHASAHSISFEPFDIKLDHFGLFNRAGIFWMAARMMPAELTRLHKNLGAALSACGFEKDRRPYSPHVSLLRQVKQDVIDYQVFSINWHVNEFVLLESTTDADGVHYKVIASYPAEL